jgi:hypothetical protein
VTLALTYPFSQHSQTDWEQNAIPLHTEQMKSVLVYITTLNPPTQEHSLLKMDSKRKDPNKLESCYLITVRSV